MKKLIHQKGLLPEKPSQNDLLNEARLAFLKKQKTKKEQEQIELFMLSLSFVQKLKTQYGPLIVADLCRNLSYMRIPAGTQIIQINKENRTFYVILSGKVSISIYVQKGQRKSSLKVIQNNNITQHSSLQQIQQASTTGAIHTQPSLKGEEEQFSLQEIKTLEQGDSFGELALIKDNLKATATVTTKSDCEFGCLTRKQYIDILGKISKNLHHEKLVFLQTIPPLKQWNDEDLKQLSYYLVLKHYVRNSIAVREGADNSQIFVVKYGVFHVVKQFQGQQLILSEMQESEIFYQHPSELKYQFSLRCASDGSSLYEFSHYDFKKYAENNNLEDFVNLEQQKQVWRIQKFEERVYDVRNVHHQEQELIETKIEFKKTIKLYEELKIRCRSAKRKKTLIKVEENSIQKTQRQAQMALKKNQILRFGDDSGENSFTLPAIRSTSRKKIYVDLIDTEKSFETLDQYNIGDSEKYQLYFDHSHPWRNVNPKKQMFN
ncbi:unnamed protein product [Paramecium octaurelia]|uniref:Cyclic nucleotide-binding domain-containing protein n=1 Tax=Paramecium octaurelia TaxID=43137 RepID=A0A8S1S0M7_PAROT|nr:unnamed protein product [Paramecium octaurelia]